MKLKIVSLTMFIAILLSACAPQATPAAVATSAPAASGNTVTVKMASFKFDPESITIKVGDTVNWINEDSAAHTVDANDGSWKSGSLAKGESFSHTFDAAGTFEYKCAFHPSMVGTVVVQP